ncbi:MAG: hypothetical protein IAI48_15360 [Candidatus Eremiobacteraeota bacterium]|nr:hypothetical protein [Candidatus Eremiobacteraeota bacterium]
MSGRRHGNRYDPLASTDSVPPATVIDRTRCSQKAMTRTTTGTIRAKSARARLDTDSESRIHAG